MNRRAIVPVLTLLISATSGAAVDPDLLRLVMPEARVLYGVHVQQTLASPFGQYVMTHLPEADAMKRFAAASGFDIQRDLREILMASSIPGNPANSADTLVLARGTFAPDKFIALAQVTGATVSFYRGVSVVNTRDGSPEAIAFLDSSTAAVGSETAVRGVIDRQQSQVFFSGSLGQKAQDASASADVWFATITPLADFAPRVPSGSFNSAALLQSVIESWVGLHFDAGGLTLSAEALTRSETEAQGLAGLLKLAIGMVQGTRAAALQNLQVAASGAVTRISLTVAEQDLERSFRTAAPRLAVR